MADLVLLQSRVGVVAIGRNEGARLARCLASLPASRFPTAYVDSGSTDGSPDLAREAGAQVISLDMTIPFSAARGRNAGWRWLAANSRGIEFIQFVDGDCEIEDGWIQTALAFLDGNPPVAVVCGRRRERFPERSFYNKVCDEEWDTPIGPAAACGGDSLVRLSILNQIDGFDPALMAGEEPEMCSRIRALGHQVWRLDRPMTIHDAAMTRFRQWWLRAVRSGLGYAQAWQVSAKGERLYATELRRALFWAGAVPLAAVGLAGVLGPVFLLFAPAVWAAQIARLSPRLGLRKAALLTVGKGAELVGMAIWVRRRVFGGAQRVVDYK